MPLEAMSPSHLWEVNLEQGRMNCEIIRNLQAMAQKLPPLQGIPAAAITIPARDAQCLLSKMTMDKDIVVFTTFEQAMMQED